MPVREQRQHLRGTTEGPPGTFIRPDAGQSASVEQSRIVDERCQGTCTDIRQVHNYISDAVGTLKPGKMKIYALVQEVMKHTDLLQKCTLEVTGSVSWDGEVPQSDLDMMIFTPKVDTDGHDAVNPITVLRELRCSLQEHGERNSIKWEQLDVFEYTRVPILRLQDSHGCHCDIAVDQSAASRHRDFLLKALEKRPQVRSMIRLVKFWMRQRGLPLASEGGLLSMGWVFAALCFADEQPAGTSCEVLLMHFFSQMSKLGEHALDVWYDASSQEFQASWQEIENPSPWSSEWMQFFRVSDPCHDSDDVYITPPSIPTALALLYTTELRLAWGAIEERQWHKLWQDASPEVRMQLPEASSPSRLPESLHVILKHGQLIAGTLQHACPCPGLPSSEVLLRRDQSSEFTLLPCGVDSDGRTCLHGEVVSFQPCHWLCVLPRHQLSALYGDCLTRVMDMAELIGFRSLSPGIRKVFPTFKQKAETASALLERKDAQVPSSGYEVAAAFGNGMPACVPMPMPYFCVMIPFPPVALPGNNGFISSIPFPAAQQLGNAPSFQVSSGSASSHRGNTHQQSNAKQKAGKSRNHADRNLSQGKPQKADLDNDVRASRPAASAHQHAKHKQLTRASTAPTQLRVGPVANSTQGSPKGLHGQVLCGSSYRSHASNGPSKGDAESDESTRASDTEDLPLGGHEGGKRSYTRHGSIEAGRKGVAKPKPVGLVRSSGPPPVEQRGRPPHKDAATTTEQRSGQVDTFDNWLQLRNGSKE
jgi:hypothetical protein